MAWATVAEVLEITGETVTSAQVTAAQHVVELHVNRTEDAEDSISTRDTNWLRHGTAWQAVWQAGKPGYATTTAVQSLTQDGTTINYRSAADQTLAPLAQRALKNLSWMGARSIAVGLRDQRSREGGDYDESFTSVDSDTGWEPM